MRSFKLQCVSVNTFEKVGDRSRAVIFEESGTRIELHSHAIPAGAFRVNGQYGVYLIELPDTYKNLSPPDLKPIPEDLRPLLVHLDSTISAIRHHHGATTDQELGDLISRLRVIEKALEATS